MSIHLKVRQYRSIKHIFYNTLFLVPSNDINFDNEPLDGSINQDCKYLEETTKVDFDENNNDGDQPINTIPDDYDNSSTYPSTFFQTEQ